MRTDIYYWKCDSPLSPETKRRLYFKEKYARADLPAQIAGIVARWLNETPAAVTPFNSDGNHFAYVIALADGRRFFFRGDEGMQQDDYLIAETRVLRDLREAGLPVPRVWFSGDGTAQCPIKFQILDCYGEKCLNEYYKAGTLDVRAVAAQLGEHLRRLHGLTYPGFGFFNTERIRRDGTLVGLDGTYTAYFHKRLDDHLGYLSDHDLLPAATIRDVRVAIERHEPLLALRQGVLVHRDMALWNVLGTPDRVTAIIDWDDCVVGDPADDLGIIACFHDEEFMVPLLDRYSGGRGVTPEFAVRIRLHTLRNMLWKTVIRDYMGYFDKDASFFLNNRGDGRSLRDVTLGRLQSALEALKTAG